LKNRHHYYIFADLTILREVCIKASVWMQAESERTTKM